MNAGLVLLSAADTDAPALPAVATVSKDDPGDDGGFGLGAAAAAAGAVWCDRPYATGNPSSAWLLERIDRAIGAGAQSVQILNEPNLALEDFQGGPEAYAALYAELRLARPDAVLLYAPPSPGVPGWEAWVSPSAPAYGVHAYGTHRGMQEIVSWYLAHTAGELWITELNPGAGNTFDLAAWAEIDLDPFLDWCALQPRVVLAAYFAWRWDQSAQLPSSIDAAECPAVVAVLGEPRASTPAPDPADPPAFDIEVVRDDLWTIADGLEQNGWPWLGQGVKALVSLSKGEQ